MSLESKRGQHVMFEPVAGKAQIGGNVTRFQVGKFVKDLFTT
jgi:hypothetical protein